MNRGRLLILLLSHLLTLAMAFPPSLGARASGRVLKLSEYKKAFRSSLTDPTIEVNQIVSKQLAGSSQDTYRFQTRKGYVARFEVIQKGVDVVVSVRSVDGTILKKTDRPSGSYGRESVTFISEFDGLALVEISAFIPEIANGAYEIKFQEFRLATATDEKRRRAEDLTSEAENARGQRPREKKLEAIEKFSDALHLWREIGDDYEQAVTLYGIGFTQFTLTNYFDAAVNYQAALRIMTALKDDFGSAVNHSALGAVQYSLGELNLSVFNYRRAIEIYKRLQNPRGLGIALHGLGNAQLLSGNYAVALEKLEESFYWRNLANDRSGKILTSFSLVNLHLLTEQINEAEKQLQETSQLLGEIRAANSSEWNYFSGRILLAKNQYQSAVTTLSLAESLYNAEGNRLRIAQTLLELSRAHAMLGQLDDADSSISRAIQIVEELRQTTPNFRSRVTFTSLIQPFFKQQLRVLSLKWKAKPSLEISRRAFIASERSRSRGLADNLERRSLLKSSQIDQMLIVKESVLRDEIAGILSNPDSDEERQLSRLQAITTEYLSLESKINDQLNIPQRTEVSPVSTEEVQASLKEDEALISISANFGNVLVWTISQSNFEFSVIEGGRELEELVERTFACVSERPKIANSNCTRDSGELGQVLLRSLGKDFVQKKLIVVKDGVFEKLPVQALLVPGSSQFLIERYEVVTIPSASLFKMMRENAIETGERKGGIAVFADPVYQSDDERLPVKVRTRNPTAEPRLPRLFASRFEANRIRDLGGDRVELFIDFEASTERFARMELNRYSIIHFATHALIDDRNPEFSSIALSAVDPSGRPRQGAIRLSDLQRFDLSADLVFLSACQTGIGKQVQGEGFISLAQSFYAAGARSVVFTGWKIDDRVTAELVSRFYKAYLVEERDAPAALREAQVSMLRDERTKHPYFWAGFLIQASYK